MKHTSLLRQAFAVLIVLGVVIPTLSATATEPQGAEKSFARSSTVGSVVDIGLSQDGSTVGRVCDQSGLALEGAEVVIKQGPLEVARTITDKQGAFSIRSLKPGVYTFSSGATEGAFRLWAERTAPPSARDQLLIVQGQNSTRGQVGATRGQSGGGLGPALLIGGAVGGGIGLGYGLGYSAGTPSGNTAGNTNRIMMPVTP